MTSHRSFSAALVALVLCASGSVAACGDDSKKSSEKPAATSAAKHPIPPALRTAESASEDAIDLALQGKRAQVVAKAKALRAVANGAAADALRKADVPAAEIAEFQRRSAKVARLAPDAPLLDVALASAAAFELVPDFFARYDSPVPATVGTLDYLDFAAKLQSLKGDESALRRLVRSLDSTWKGLRPNFVAAGGKKVAPSFDAHVAAMRKLVSNSDPAKTQREAQHGLDLVDELEHVYSR